MPSGSPGSLFPEQGRLVRDSLQDIGQPACWALCPSILDHKGELHRQIHPAALHEAFETITDNTGLGHRRSDLSERHRTFNVEQHAVVYTVSGPTMNVVRILHGRMDFTRRVRH